MSTESASLHGGLGDLDGGRLGRRARRRLLPLAAATVDGEPDQRRDEEAADDRQHDREDERGAADADGDEGGC